MGKALAGDFNSSIYFKDIKIKSLFWNKILDKNYKVTINTVIDKCFKTGRVDNFIKSGKYLKIGMDKPLPDELKFEGRFYDDSDVYKAIEGAAYTLMQYDDKELENNIDRVIEAIESAQWPDGYIMTYYTIDPEKKGQRWSDMDKHEMYNGGHLIEAAVAYYYATGKDKLLNVAKKMVNCWMNTFGPGKRHWVEGHQEPELALIKLYELTKDKKYIEFALWLLSERGHGHYFSESRPYLDKDELFYKSEYCQDHIPVEQQSFVCGHAVRAMYMYSGMADIARYMNKKEYIAALDRIWENIIEKNMYVTGGIGSSVENEGFTYDFDLPNLTAYAETCASIGMVFFNHRMNLLHRDAKYADIIEKEIYNGVLSGVSLNGDKFFYINPLEANGKKYEEGGHRRRQEWFKTSCCPTNLARFLPSISQYIYSLDNEGFYINQYIGSQANIKINNNEVLIIQKTNYPWDGEVEITFLPKENVITDIYFRIPNWCSEYSYYFKGKVYEPIKYNKGYICLKVKIDKESKLYINFDMPVLKVHMDPRVKEDEGKVALQRGPIVYCFEKEDNPDGINDIIIKRETKFETIWDPNMLDGIIKINVINGRQKWIAIPYYAWDNRSLGEMKVFVEEEIDNARIVKTYK